MIDCRVGCFGKLPFHADFIRHGTTAEFNAFDELLGKGILHARAALGSGWSAAYAAGTPRAFVRHHPDSGRLLCGVVRPSRGKAGRDFPFLVAASFDLVALRRRPAILPLLCEDLLAGALTLVARDWSAGDIAEVRREVDALSGPVDEGAAGQRLDAALAQSTYEELLTQGLGAFDDRRSLFLLNATSLLGPRSKPKFAVVLPPASGPVAVAVWLELAARLRGDPARFPHLAVWSPGPDAGDGVRCALVEPTGEHFVPLFLPHSPNDACELYQEGLESPSLLEKAKGGFDELAQRKGDLSLLLKDLASVCSR